MITGVNNLLSGWQRVVMYESASERSPSTVERTKLLASVLQNEGSHYDTGDVCSVPETLSNA